MNCGLPDSSGVSQARILEWDVISFSRKIRILRLKELKSLVQGSDRARIYLLILLFFKLLILYWSVAK